MSRQNLYPGGDGITRISDPFWMNYCGKCGHSFWSCMCTVDCPKCGNQDLRRELGKVPYEQIIAERGEPIKPKSEFIRVYPNKSEFASGKDGEKLNRLGFIILSILRKSDATSRLSSMTVREIATAEEFGLKENTIFKKIKDFENSGYIGRGLKEGRADTFFITPEGCKCLEKERGKS